MSKVMCEKCASITPHNPPVNGEYVWCWFCYNTAFTGNSTVDRIQMTLNHHMNELMFQLARRGSITIQQRTADNGKKN